MTGVQTCALPIWGAYLRAQRDRIVAQKKKERDIKAEKYEADHHNPPSADRAEISVPLPKFTAPNERPVEQESKQEIGRASCRERV